MIQENARAWAWQYIYLDACGYVFVYIYCLFIQTTARNKNQIIRSVKTAILL